MGKAHKGKMDAILTDSRLDTGIRTCICMYPKLCESTKARTCRRRTGRQPGTRDTVGNSTDDSSS